jgi:predicted permease
LQLFIDVLTGITLPILVLVALGWVAQRKLGFDLDTLMGLQVYVILPAALIHFLTSAELPLGAAWPTAWFTLLQFAAHFALGWGLAILLRLDRSLAALLGLAVAFPNSGNYGLPMIALTFAPDFLLLQTITTSIHIIIISTAGVWLMARGGPQPQSFVRTLFGTPVLPAVAFGLLIKGLEVKLPAALALPLELMGQAFTPMALFLLGAQLTTVAAGMQRGPLGLASVLKLLAAPALSWLLAWLLDFSPSMIAFFVVGTATPTGILMVIFAAQYRVHVSLTSALVFFTTLASALTVTGWIFALKFAGYMP